jgi:hypothetical protein
MNKQFHFILTAPHAQCPSIIPELPSHPCDTLVKQAVQLFAELLSYYKENTNLKITTFLGNIQRHQSYLPWPFYTSRLWPNLEEKVLYCDLNRDACSFTEYRRKLTKLLKKEMVNKNNVWLFDIHSYPKESHEETGDLECYFILPFITKNHLKKTRNLVRYLTINNIKVGLFHGTRENSIIEQAIRMGFMNVFLVEFREDLTEARLKTIIFMILSLIFL